MLEDYRSTFDSMHPSNLSYKASSINSHLLAIFSIILTEFLIMGISLGTLPGYLHKTLGFGNIIVGIVIGVQYVATLLTRHLAGSSADRKGGTSTVYTGLVLTATSSMLSVTSILTSDLPSMSLALILVGRALLGIGESYLVIGIFSWGFALVGKENTGRVMVWNGMGMHAGMACGAPLGAYLVSTISMSAAFSLTILLPIIVCVR